MNELNPAVGLAIRRYAATQRPAGTITRQDPRTTPRPAPELSAAPLMDLHRCVRSRPHLARRPGVLRRRRRGRTEVRSSALILIRAIKPQFRRMPGSVARPRPGAERDWACHACPGPADGRPASTGGCRCERFMPRRARTPGFPVAGCAHACPCHYHGMTFFIAAVERLAGRARRSRGNGRRAGSDALPRALTVHILGC